MTSLLYTKEKVFKL